MRDRILLALSFLSSVLTISAANLAVTPSVVSNDFAGQITLKIIGLASGESVRLEQFFDANLNGAADAGEPVVRSAVLTDGQASLIGGATNINILRDEDETANGEITASFSLSFAPDVARGSGPFLFRASSPSNHFAAVTAPFTILGRTYPQTVRGTVKSSGTNVPLALVALTQQTADGVPKVIVGAPADLSGNFNLSTPAGAYQLIAFKAGYVLDMPHAPNVLLAPGATVTTNIDLLPATQVLAGSLRDPSKPAAAIGASAELLAFSTNLLVTVSLADTNGNFAIPVTPGVWTVRVADQSALSQGLLLPDPNIEAHFVTLFGPVSDATVNVKSGSSLLYGTARDNHGNPIAGLTIFANGDGAQYNGVGLTDSNGNYSMAMNSGGGFAQVSNLEEAPANQYIWSSKSFNVTDGQALRVDFVGTVATTTLQLHVADETGAPVSNFFFYASGNTGVTMGDTDANGILNLPIAAGQWRLYAGANAFGDSTSRGLVLPDLPSVTISDGQNQSLNIVARRATAQISGRLHGSTNAAVSGINLTLSATQGTTNYTLSTYTDSQGSFAFPVFAGTWTLSADVYGLRNAGYAPITSTNIAVPPSVVLDLVASAATGPAITTSSLPGPLLGKFYYAPLNATGGTPDYTWRLASGSLPPGLSLDPDFGEITGTATTAGTYSFTLEAKDASGRTATAALTLTVQSESGNPAPTTLKLVSVGSGQQFALSITGQAGQSYTVQRSASLSEWTDVLTTNAPSDSFSVTISDATTETGFYRVRSNP